MYYNDLLIFTLDSATKRIIWNDDIETRELDFKFIK